MIVGLIGHPVAHSKSPHMQNAAFAHVGLTDWRYELWDTPLDDLPARIREMSERDDIAGCNVTIPHKQAVMQHLDAVDEHARAIGAVNTIVRQGTQSVVGTRSFASLRGHNTDWTGFLADLAFHGMAVHAGTRALVLGAGGSARAIVYALLSRGAHVAICNRTPARARELLEDLARLRRAHEGAISCSVVASPSEPACSGASLVVNCTSAGMWPNDEATPWPANLPFPATATLYDLVYKPRETALMRQAEASGARAIGGIGMLAEQGAAAFELWTGVPAARVSGIMRDALNHA